MSGALSVESAMRLIVARTRLVHELAPPGAMAAIFADEASVADALAAAGPDIAIAALNGPEHVVVSGARETVGAVASAFEARGVRVNRLHVSYASHSPLMQSVLEPYAAEVARESFAAPSIPLVSNLTGSFVDGDTMARPDYWCEHLRRPVQFTRAMHALHTDGITHFVEAGPHSVLLGIGAACLPPGYGSWIPSQQRDADAWSKLLDAVQLLYAGGADIDWDAFDAPWPHQAVSVPTYPFERRRHWMDSLGIRGEQGDTARERWQRVEGAMARASTQGPIDLDVSTYSEIWASLSRLTDAHALRLLHRAGLFAAPGERRTLDDVMRTTRIRSAYAHLVERRLDGLVAAGTLRRDSEAWFAASPVREPAMGAAWAEAEARLARNP
ncbi:MAG: acyltransferase domain-containing protein, partial [Gemmatimonadaceae bacterium]